MSIYIYVYICSINILLLIIKTYLNIPAYVLTFAVRSFGQVINPKVHGYGRDDPDGQ